MQAYPYKEHRLCCVGSTCVLYKDLLLKAASDFGIEIAKIIRYSMPGLIEYHAAD